VGPAAPATESPLGIRPYQAYEFVATPFTVRLAATPVTAKVAATVQALLKIAERERSIESRTLLVIENRPLHQARFVVPPDLKLDRVLAPGTFEWALTDEGGRRVLTVYLSGGIQGACSIVVRGKLGEDRQGLETGVPRFEILDVDRQEGDIVVQVDPAFDVRSENLTNIERVLLERTFGWLNPDQRGMAQLALHYTRPDYSGRLILAPRKPDVTCFTVTNARVTDRTIEDAVLLNWTIKNAGIREVAFLLPAWMKDARISVPLLRQKTVTPVQGDPALVRVQLQLQDEVMNELRVLVENDRLLTRGVHDVPIPVVETGRTDRRYVAVESAGRDEVEVEKKDGLEPLSRQQKEWTAVAGLLRGGMTQAFIVTPGAEKPLLAFKTRQRETVETVKARIGLAKAVLVMDSSGAYRAEQLYRIDNRTEQFLDIQVPEGAALWTAIVAGQPVKPTMITDVAAPRCLRIPIVKTAAGDLDYAVVLKYGGKLPPLEALRMKVQFPLIRAVNVNAELSQVELHLPPEQAWFYFRTKMTPVEEEGAFRVGELLYLGKAADRLIQTVRSDNPFAQARAKANLKTIVQSMQDAQQSVSTVNLNTADQADLARVGVIVKNAEKEVQEQAGQAAPVVAADNNDAIRSAFAGQRGVLARNRVNTLGGNWTGVAAQPQAPPQTEGQVAFNNDWFASNKLEYKPADMGKVQGGKERWAQESLAGPGQPPPQGQQPAQARGKQMFEKFSEEVGKGKAADQQKPETDRPQRRGNVDELVQRYQEKLDKRAQEDQKVAQKDQEQLKIIRAGRGGREIGGWQGVGGGLEAFTGKAQEATVPAGMASLDVELPQRGLVYRFTTPRGDVDVAASAASKPLIEGLERVGGVAVLIILVLAARRLLRGRSFDIRTLSIASTVLIVLGVIGMVLGIVPVPGLVAMVVGVAIKIHLFRVRRRPAAA
jgi:hypothetical protein